MSLYQPLHLRWAAQCLVPLHLNLLHPNPFFEAFGVLCYSHPTVSGIPIYCMLNLCKMKYNILNRYLYRSPQNQFTCLPMHACFLFFSRVSGSVENSAHNRICKHITNLLTRIHLNAHKCTNNISVSLRPSLFT
jgi:hypothetical protein